MITETQQASDALGTNSDAREVVAARGVRDTVLVLMGVSGCGKNAVALELSWMRR